MFDVIFKEFFTLLGIFLVFDILKFYYKYFTRPNPLPGPIPLPYIGNAFQIIYMLFKAGIYQFDLGEYTRLQAEKYGDLSETYQGSTRIIYLSKAEYLEKVYLQNADTIYFRRPVVNGVRELNVSGLIFNNDHKSWKRNRKFVTQSLMSPKFLRGFTITIQKLFEENESGWNRDDDEKILDLSDWIKCFTTDITISTSTRQQSYCLASNDLKESEWTNDMKESRKIKDAVELYFKSLTFFSIVPKIIRFYFPIFSHYQKYFMNNLTFLQNEILDRVKKRREQIERMSEKEKVGDDLLDILLTANTPRDPHGWKRDDIEKPLTDIEIRDNIVDITITGSDTSSNLFVVVFWYINTYPEVKARFLEEIESIFGNEITDHKIAYDDLDKFKYLDAIIKESSRMRPIVSMTGRELSSSDTIAGYKWDSDTKIYLNFIHIQRHKDYWKEPEKFIPDRFLNDENEIIKNSLTPFGGGVRFCPGKLTALAEIKTLLILFFGKYNVDLVDKVNPLKHVYAGISLYPDFMIKLSPKYKRKVQ